MAKQIIAMLPPHRTYIEPFAGGAQVFFHKQPSAVEILNDLDGNLVSLWRVLQSHHEEFIRYFRFIVVSREWYELLRKTDPATLTDVQRAARYFYLLKASFAGIVKRPSYHYHVVQPPGLNLERLPELIEKTHKRLARVQIEHSSYEKILTRYDRKTSVFYLDPPYYGRALYLHSFTPEDFGLLEQRLRKLLGKFILSLNDVPEVRSLFSRFHLHSVDLHYTAQKHSGRRYKELLITNFKK